MAASPNEEGSVGVTPELWQRVQDVLEQALELSLDERPAFLDRACSSDPLLRREVETLLASSLGVRSSFLQSSSMPRVTLTPETKLGEYEVKSLVGSGGMGEVYRARDSRLGRDVAIKVLPSSLSADSDRLRRFEQEARTAAALNHPNILAVFQMGTYEGAPYLVSELLEGETLREQIKRGRLPVRKAIDYGVQIARGLAAAHGKGIVHRDLKPENLFVNTEGRVKILDFGLAKLTQPQSSSQHDTPTLSEGTEPGVVMGTVGYMSPEQVRGQAVDHRTDIFAFGAVLYEMLAGQRAFQKPTSPETMTAILNEDPPGISQVTTNVPAALERVVHRCLEKKPELRFQSASDLAFALDPLSETAQLNAATKKAGDRKRGNAIAVAALVSVLSVGGYYVYSHDRSKRDDKDTVAVANFANTNDKGNSSHARQGTISLTVDSPDRQLLTYYRGADSSLYQLVWPNWDPDRWTQIAGVHGRPPVDQGSGIASYVSPLTRGPEVFYLAQGSEHVEQISLLGLIPTDLNIATGSPAGARGSSLAGFVDDCAGTDNLVYIGDDQHVHLLMWTRAQGWTTQDLTSLTHSTPAAGTAITGRIHGKAEGAFHLQPEHLRGKSEGIFYFQPDHHLHELWRWSMCPGGAQFDGWKAVDVSSESSSAVVDAAEGSPLSGFWVERNSQDADFYIDSRRHLQEMLFTLRPKPVWTNVDVTEVSGSPELGVNAIAAHFNTVTDSEWIYFLDSKRNVHAVTASVKAPTQWKEQLRTALNVLPGRCQGSGAPAPAAAFGSPLAAGVNSMLNGSEEVFYVGEDEALYELRQTEGEWSCMNLTKMSGAPNPAR